ncbi:DUF1330 domain-containing protein [Micromonospora sp. NPDC048170]|uniref:DUF1330 domain-containing protein n=1 Tax=Micromonospora sp. NPDC048170 TaxID=3154819 RepID=UPI0033CA6398
MPAFALAQLHDVPMNEDILTYLERIQATLDPFEGRFRVHGATVEVREGDWPGSVVIVEFPDLDRARAWYDSPAYQEILPLRTRHIPGAVLFVDGVAPGYDASRTAARLRAQVAG